MKTIYENDDFSILFVEEDRYNSFNFFIRDKEFKEFVNLDRDLFLDFIKNTYWERRFRDNLFDDMNLQLSQELIENIFKCFTENFEKDFVGNFGVNGLYKNSILYFLLLKYLKEKFNNPRFDLVYSHFETISGSAKIVVENLVEASRELAQDHIVKVIIVSPDNDLSYDINEKLINSVGDFMITLGFSFEAKEEPIYGSLIQVINFVRKNVTTSRLRQIVGFGKKAIVATVVDVPSAEVTGELARSASDLIKATETHKNVAIRIGQLLIIKTTDENGSADLKVETVSPELSKLFNDNPSILDKPKELFAKIVELQDLSENRDIEKIG